MTGNEKPAMAEQQRFVKKPVEVEAIQFTEQSKDRCFNFVRGTCYADFEDGSPILKVQTIHGDTAIVRLDDWIVKENAPGAYYPVKPDIFEETYAPAGALSHAEGEQAGMKLVPEQSDPNWELRVSKSLNLSHMDAGRNVIHAVLETAPAGEPETGMSTHRISDAHRYDSPENKRKRAQQPVSDPDGIVERLRGQLQNCVNHLERAKNRAPGEYGEKYRQCIEGANAALYETLGNQAAPDEREIAARALEGAADLLEAYDQVMAARQVRSMAGDHRSRLRAGKGDE